MMAPVSFEIKLEDGCACYCHQDHVSEDEPIKDSSEKTDYTHFPTARGNINGSANKPAEQQQQMTDNESIQVAENGQRGCYPKCVRRPPDQIV